MLVYYYKSKKDINTKYLRHKKKKSINYLQITLLESDKNINTVIIDTDNYEKKKEFSQ